MLKFRIAFSRFLLLISVLLSVVSGAASCGTKVTAFSPLTVLSGVSGNVLIQKPGAADWINGKEGTTLETGFKIKTAAGATASITFFDGSAINLNSGTEISLDDLVSKSSSSPKSIKISQKIGETKSTILKMVDSASRYQVDTQSGVASVRGSIMAVVVSDDSTTRVYNIEGVISFTAQGKEVMIPTGSVSTAKPGEVPSAPQPGTPPEFSDSSATLISSRTGWQQTGLFLSTGDKFYIDYRGGSWNVDYNKFPYVGPAGYSADIDKTIAVGFNAKIDTSVPYGYLLGKVGSGKEMLIGNKSGPFTANANGFLSLRINDIDSALGDNDGAITVGLRGDTNYASMVPGALRRNPPHGGIPAVSEAVAGYAVILADGPVYVSLSAGSPGKSYGVYVEEYRVIAGGDENYQSWAQVGSLTTDINGKGVFSGTVSKSPGTHYLQIGLSQDGQWGPAAFGTGISEIAVK